MDSQHIRFNLGLAHDYSVVWWRCKFPIQQFAGTDAGCKPGSNERGISSLSHSISLPAERDLQRHCEPIKPGADDAYGCDHLQGWIYGCVHGDDGRFRSRELPEQPVRDGTSCNHGCLCGRYEFCGKQFARNDFLPLCQATIENDSLLTPM